MTDLHRATDQARAAGWREGMQEALAVAETHCREQQKSAEASPKSSAAQKQAQAMAATAAEIAEILRERIRVSG